MSFQMSFHVVMSQGVEIQWKDKIRWKADAAEMENIERAFIEEAIIIDSLPDFCSFSCLFFVFFVHSDVMVLHFR